MSRSSETIKGHTGIKKVKKMSLRNKKEKRKKFLEKKISQIKKKNNKICYQKKEKRGKKGKIILVFKKGKQNSV